MLERVERRTLTLDGVVDLCRREAEQVQDYNVINSPIMSTCNCQDSGIFNGDHHNSNSNKLPETPETSYSSILSTGSSVQQLSPRRTRAVSFLK